jgi:hypothetical protein
MTYVALFTAIASGCTATRSVLCFRAHGLKEHGMAIVVGASILGWGGKGRALSSTLHLGVRHNR